MSNAPLMSSGADIVSRRTWIDSFVRVADHAPEDIAVVDDHGRELTRARLRTESARVLGVLRDEWGVGEGTVVGVHLENTIENMQVVLALGALGAVCAPISTKFTPAEILRQVQAFRPALVVTDQTEPGDLPVRVVDCADVMAAAGTVTATDVEAEFDRLARARDVDSPSTIICTSGSTAAPKAIVLSHGNVMFAIASSQSYYALSPVDVGLTFFPWCHSNGHINQLLCWLALGVRVAVADRFSASGFVGQLERFDPTVVFMNSTHIKMVLAKLDPAVTTVSSRMRIVPTALDMNATDVKRFTGIFGALLRKVYYQTELCAPVTICDLIPTRVDVNTNPLGYPSLSHRLRLLDESGNDVPVGAPGEIAVRASVEYGVAMGRLDADTGELIRNDPHAWWHTGDLAQADADGFLYFCGRTSDMIKRAGHNVAMAEVIATLLEHPAVAEAAVIGVPDPIREEQIVAFVTGGADPADVVAFCNARLAEYKVPSVVIGLERIPHTDLGKLDNKALRDVWASGAQVNS